LKGGIFTPLLGFLLLFGSGFFEADFANPVRDFRCVWADIARAIHAVVLRSVWLVATKSDKTTATVPIDTFADDSHFFTSHL
jgi:hypothetical protein